MSLFGDKKSLVLIKLLRAPLDWLLRTKRCPFCCEPAPALVFRNGSFHCRDCGTSFNLDSGFLEPVYPAGGPQSTYNPHSSISISLPNGLCQKCNHNQDVMIRLVLAYDGDLDHIDAYRRELERRYQLCAVCQYAVQERLKRVTYQIKAKSIVKKTLEPRRKSSKWILASCLLLHYFLPHTYTVPYIICIMISKQWYHIVLIPPALLFPRLSWLLAFFVPLIPKPVASRPKLQVLQTPSDLSDRLNNSAWGLGDQNDPRPSRANFPGVKLPEKKPSSVNHRSAIGLHPSRLGSHKDIIGIEEAFQGISLSDDKKESKPSFSTLVARLILVIARLFFHSDQLVACLFAFSFFLSRNKPLGIFQMLCLARLLWLVLESCFLFTLQSQTFKTSLDCFLLLCS